MRPDWWLGIAGGVLIGGAGALLLFSHRRIAGISGVIGGLLQPARPDRAWRVAFVAGLLLAGFVGMLVAPRTIGASVRGLPLVAVAGVVVGFGTRLGNGCTSGHAVYGLARLSPRSIAATLTFMTAGAITVYLAGLP